MSDPEIERLRRENEELRREKEAAEAREGVICGATDADEHADAEVIGVDCMPIQSSWLPPNLSFEIDNVEDTWTWAKPFDYIFCRAMIGSIENWPRLVKQAFKQLEPGGWLEIQDHCYPLRCDDNTVANSKLLKWSQLIVEATDRTGRSVTVAPSFRKMMEDAGFEEVEETQVKLPINSWAKDEWHKELGRWTHASHSTGLEGVSLYLFTQVLKWTREETLVFLADVRKDLNNRGIHGYWPAYLVHGRKPPYLSSRQVGLCS